MNKKIALTAALMLTASSVAAHGLLDDVVAPPVTPDVAAPWEVAPVVAAETGGFSLGNGTGADTALIVPVNMPTRNDG
jgi:hypothetical protein